jgi:multiple sugar transport system permease protein
MTSPTLTRRRRAGKLREAVSFAMLCVVALVFMAPLIFMVATSFKLQGEVFTKPPTLLGSEFRWQNYVEAFTFAPFGRYLLNSVLVSTLGTAINMAVAVLAGYAFSRIKWRGRGIVFSLFLATMMIPTEVLVVPMFVMIQKFGWINSYQGLILPWAFAAFGAFMLRQFFLTVPNELEDAAHVDGAGTLRTFFQIMLPLARPTIAVLSVFQFIGYWNSFLWPLVVVNDVQTLAPIPLGLQSFLGQNFGHWELIMAGSVLAMAPIVLLLILMQKHLIKGIVTSGLGGR